MFFSLADGYYHFHSSEPKLIFVLIENRRVRSFAYFSNKPMSLFYFGGKCSGGDCISLASSLALESVIFVLVSRSGESWSMYLMFNAIFIFYTLSKNTNPYYLCLALAWSFIYFWLSHEDFLIYYLWPWDLALNCWVGFF